MATAKLQRELATAVYSLESVTSARDELVQSRIPGLTPLAYDEVVQIAEAYGPNISFTMTMANQIPAYEYRIVLSNNGLSAIIPDMNIKLFDELGIQLGQSQIPEQTTQGSELEITLDLGEIQTYSGTVDVESSKSPQYFLLYIN